MPNPEEGVRVAGTNRITCVVTSAGTTVTLTEIVRKLMLMEAIDEKTITEDTEGVLVATVENETRGP